jgi:serpin B
MATATWITGLLAVVLAAGAGEAAAAGRPATPDEVEVVTGNSEFALDLYARLRAREGNVFLSPYSISSALGMTHAGARGPTAAEMARVLRLPFTGDRLHRAFGAIIRNLDGGDSKSRAELRVASALWPQAGLAIDSGFQTIATTHFGAGLQPLDFRRAPERARTAINAWVEQQTQDRIAGLVPEGTLTPATRLVLTNAVYFKGTWRHAFPERQTRNAPFTLATGRQTAGVPLMTQRGHFQYLDGGSFQALELPYEENELSMIVFLPAAVDGLAGLEQTLTAGRVSDWLARMTVHDVEVNLPRFRMTAMFQLRQALTDLGMPLAFTAGRADFSGIATGEPLWLSAVIHKAYVDVSEKGTEAAAATGVVVQTTSALRVPVPRAVFRADHPFFFVIRETRTGTLLFAGRVVTPLGG